MPRVDEGKDGYTDYIRCGSHFRGAVHIRSRGDDAMYGATTQTRVER